MDKKILEIKEYIKNQEILKDDNVINKSIELLEAMGDDNPMKERFVNDTLTYIDAILKIKNYEDKKRKE